MMQRRFMGVFVFAAIADENLRDSDINVLFMLRSKRQWMMWPIETVHVTYYILN